MAKTWADVGQAVTARRHELGLTQTAASMLSETSLSTWQKLEARSTAPAARSLRKMATALRWPADFADQILAGVDKPEGEIPAGPYVDVLAERVAKLETESYAQRATIADLTDDVLTLDTMLTAIVASLTTLRLDGFEAPQSGESVAARHARRALASLPDDEREAIIGEHRPRTRRGA